ncbi:HNH endonuclease, partial [candidate division KSB1 bacterium]
LPAPMKNSRYCHLNIIYKEKILKCPSKLTKCNICLKEKALTWEHIIPESLGGTLQSNIQCVDCNSTLGSELIASAKKTHPIRLAILSLQNVIPDLFKSIEEGQWYTNLKDIGKTDRLIYKDGNLKTYAESKPDGSIILDEADTISHLKRILKKDGLDASEIESVIDEYEKAPSETPITLSDKTTTIKSRFAEIYQTPGKVDTDERVIMLIAYNYLCLFYGELLLKEDSSFIRKLITEQQTSSRILIRQHYYTEEYQPFHKIYHIVDEDHVIVFISLFESIVYEVHLEGILTDPEINYVVIEDLKNKRIKYAASIEEAKKGNYLTNKPC